jgi:hypothetical protein
VYDDVPPHLFSCLFGRGEGERDRLAQGSIRWGGGDVWRGQEGGRGGTKNQIGGCFLLGVGESALGKSLIREGSGARLSRALASHDGRLLSSP